MAGQRPAMEDGARPSTSPLRKTIETQKAELQLALGDILAEDVLSEAYRDAGGRGALRAEMRCSFSGAAPDLPRCAQLQELKINPAARAKRGAAEQDAEPQRSRRTARGKK